MRGTIHDGPQSATNQLHILAKKLAPAFYSWPAAVVHRLALCLLVLLASPPAKAQLGTALSVVGGGILVEKAGDELRDSIDRAHAAASSLLGVADEIAKKRLEQIDNILKSTVNELVNKTKEDALAVLEKARKDAVALEKEIFTDVKKVIWETECAGRRILIGDVSTALGSLGQMLGTNQLRVVPPRRVLQTPSWYTGCLWWCRDPYIVDVKEPFGETYKQVRNLMEASIAPELIDENTPAHHLVGTYEYLSSLAKRTSCFYQGSEDRYNREYIKYQEMARRWNNILDVSL